jgi:folate-binding protein YgfZ
MADINTKTTAYFMPLSQLGILQVSGDDAASFLQSMLTNDVQSLNVNQSQLSGFCNAKGRLFAVFLLVRRSNGFQIILPKSMCTTLQQRLSMFVLRSNVTITDSSEASTCLGLTQPKNIDIADLTLPNDIYQSTEHDNSLLIKLPANGSHRYLYLSSPDQSTALSNILQNQQWQLADEAIWQLLDIEADLPMIFPETKEMFTPQQVNLDLIDGVNFDKGCYPGQEIVARLHYLGSPSRRMFLAYSQSIDSLPTPGTKVFDLDGNMRGHLVQAQYDANKILKLLLTLKLSEAEQRLFIDDKTLYDITSIST